MYGYLNNIYYACLISVINGTTYKARRRLYSPVVNRTVIDPLAGSAHCILEHRIVKRIMVVVAASAAHYQ